VNNLELNNEFSKEIEKSRAKRVSVVLGSLHINRPASEVLNDDNAADDDDDDDDDDAVNSSFVLHPVSLDSPDAAAGSIMVPPQAATTTRTKMSDDHEMHLDLDLDVITITARLEKLRPLGARRRKRIGGDGYCNQVLDPFSRKWVPAER
jgi:hypothetical protein